MAKPNFIPSTNTMMLEIRRLNEQLAKANERNEKHEGKTADLLTKLAKANAIIASLECDIAKANERVKELEAQVDFKIKECVELAQACNRHKACIEQLRKEQSHD